METRIAENIRAYRKQRGLTQEQLAEVLGETAVDAVKVVLYDKDPELRKLWAEVCSHAE